MDERRVAILGSLLLLVTGPVFAQVFSGSVSDVEDGDTFTVLRDNAPVTVQLHGLDAPEPEQPFGPCATEFVRRRIEGERVRVRIMDRDRFGRLIARVMHDGSDLIEQVLQARLAWYYWSYDEYTPDAARNQTLEYRAQRARTVSGDSRHLSHPGIGAIGSAVLPMPLGAQRSCSIIRQAFLTIVMTVLPR